MSWISSALHGDPKAILKLALAGTALFAGGEAFLPGLLGGGGSAAAGVGAAGLGASKLAGLLKTYGPLAGQLLAVSKSGKGKYVQEPVDPRRNAAIDRQVGYINDSPTRNLYAGLLSQFSQNAAQPYGMPSKPMSDLGSQSGMSFGNGASPLAGMSDLFKNYGKSTTPQAAPPVGAPPAGAPPTQNAGTRPAQPPHARPLPMGIDLDSVRRAIMESNPTASPEQVNSILSNYFGGMKF